MFVMLCALPGCGFVLFIWYYIKWLNEVSSESRPGVSFVVLILICGWYWLSARSDYTQYGCLNGGRLRANFVEAFCTSSFT